jgi:alkylhydroperoxidase family enzyme
MTDERFPLRMRDGIDRSWRDTASPGTWLTGDERVAAAAIARSSFGSGETIDGPSSRTVVEDAARMVAVDAHRIDRAMVDRLAADGLTTQAYVEVVGVVARTVAVDTTIRGLGIEPLAFPVPAEGTPSRIAPPNAKRRSAFVPMIGAAGATNALSAVVAEDAAQEDLHGALYLSYAEMADIGIVKGLERWQLELVAARTSLINRCHF